MHRRKKRVQLKFGKDEQVLKSWDYAKAGHTFDKDKQECNLTVTNKRIISTKESTYSLDREEIPLKEVHGIEGTYRRNTSIWTKIKLFFGIILCIVIIGIPMVIKALKELRACVLELTITTNGGDGDPLCIGVAGAANNVKRFHLFGNSLNKFKVYVDKEMAREILDEIGSVVLDNK